MKGYGVSPAKGNEVCRSTRERGWGTRQQQQQSQRLQRQTTEGKTTLRHSAFAFAFVSFFFEMEYKAIGLVAIEFRISAVHKRVTVK